MEGLRRAGKELTREDLIDAIETLDSYFVGIGAKVSFGPNDRQGVDQVYFTKIENGKVTMFTDWKNFTK
jgi:branched-chain amino acid transport system substrate-binding protein